jgi:prolyl 4-hydroxylase
MAARCPPLPDAIPALKPGDLNKMFERIVETAPGNRTLTEDERKQLAADETTEYSVVVHSRPTDGLSLVKDMISLSKDKGLPPWVITFDNFIAPEECEAMIQLGYKYEYKRSADVGAQNFDGSHEAKESTGRTSENAWCSERQGCRNETIPTRIHNRMSKVLGIPAENSEDLQILKYEVGQYYNTHHDYIPHQKGTKICNIYVFVLRGSCAARSLTHLLARTDRQCGPRILTFFIYLSDVETGGGTDFPLLGLTVIPKKGRAVLWPSVYDSNALLEDGRTEHQALPVEAGTKFAANGWIHLFDYVGAQDRGCN